MSLLNKNHLDSLVAVGQIKKDNQREYFECSATSFLVGLDTEEATESGEKLYRLFLVTNKHVFNNKDRVVLRFNTQEGEVVQINQSLKFEDGEPRWLSHEDPQVDLALLSVNAQKLIDNAIKPTFIPEDIFVDYSRFEEVGIAPGDDVFVLGFPMGVAGTTQNYACVKAGIVSRSDSEIERENKAFIIDSSIFPGNSGGPVIIKPSAISLKGTKAVKSNYLIGVVSAYIPYTEKLYSLQTNPPSVVSLERENSGLSKCVPVDYIRSTYQKWLDHNKPVEPSAENTDEEENATD